MKRCYGSGSHAGAHAVPTMMGEVRRRDHGWAVKVPRRLKDLQRQLVQARGELSQRLGSAPTASEIADHLDIDHELVVEAVIAGSSYSTRSTDVQAGPDDEYRPLGETLGDVDPNLDTVIDVESVRPISRPCRTASDRPDAAILRESDPDLNSGTHRLFADARLASTRIGASHKCAAKFVSLTSQ